MLRHLIFSYENRHCHPQPERGANLDPQQILERYRTEINDELGAILAQRTSPLYDMMRYHLGWVDAQGRPTGEGGGKALRPTLCLLACQAVGGDYRTALPAAAALELIHNFSLIHDDIEDRSPERRHCPTVWWQWGVPQAINAGDAMHALGRLALLRLEERDVLSTKVLRAARMLDEACLRLCQGQYLDISFQDRLDIGVDAYLEMIGGKTASLIESALCIGALLGTDGEEVIERFRRCGRNLGLAFQMRDDVLGIWGEDEIIGKSSATDIQEKKKSLPIIYALEKATGQARAELVGIYNKASLEAEDIAVVRGILDALGAQMYVQVKAQDYYRQALAELDGLGLSSPAQEELRNLAAFLVEREY